MEGMCLSALLLLPAQNPPYTIRELRRGLSSREGTAPTSDEQTLLAQGSSAAPRCGGAAGSHEAIQAPLKTATASGGEVPGWPQGTRQEHPDLCKRSDLRREKRDLCSPRLPAPSHAAAADAGPVAGCVPGREQQSRAQGRLRQGRAAVDARAAPAPAASRMVNWRGTTATRPLLCRRGSTW